MKSVSGQQDQNSVPVGSHASGVTCCLCRRPVPSEQEVFALDAEWQRRFPSMLGVLACEECVLEIEWQCQDAAGEYVAGHIPARDLAPEAQDFDSWSHLPAHGSQVAMVQQYANPTVQQSVEKPPTQVAARQSGPIDLSEQRTELMGLINAWQTTRPSRPRVAK